MDVFTRLDEVRDRIDVLEHPFYLRWSAGELCPQELEFYAGEYRHAVLALAQASRDAAAKAGPEHAPELWRHAEEEQSHVELWDQFAARASLEVTLAPDPGTERERIRDSMAGAQSGAAPAPLAQTSRCVAAWTAGEDLLEHLCVLYAIEAGQPAISQTKLQGLHAHYGYPQGSPGTEYFTVHATRDVEHAQAARELIERLIGEEGCSEQRAERMISCAQHALEGNWTLLDGVEQRFAAI